MQEEPSQNKQPGWLKRVQQQSWEPEILISGLVLYALFQAPELIDSFSFYLEHKSANFFSDSTVNETSAAMLKISVYILISGFMLHLFLRSIWVAYAGLSYLYRDGINFEALHLPDKYLTTIQSSGYEDKVKKLEKICSGMFSLSFLFFMIVLGLVHVGIIISVLAYVLITFVPGFTYYWLFNLLFLFALIFILDLFTLGILRRVPYLRSIYYPVYRVVRVFLLAPFYEDIYYGFLSHNKKWKIALLTFGFSLIFCLTFIEIRFPGELLNAFSLDINSDDEALLYSGHYEDKITPDRIGRAMIPSDIIKDNVLRVFIAHFTENETTPYLTECLGDDYEHRFVDELEQLDCLNGLYRVAVNDSVYAADGLFQYSEPMDINGMVYWLDIAHLGRGSHQLKAWRKRVGQDTTYYQRVAQIEFFKDFPALK